MDQAIYFGTMVRIIAIVGVLILAITAFIFGFKQKHEERLPWLFLGAVMASGGSIGTWIDWTSDRPIGQFSTVWFLCLLVPVFIGIYSWLGYKLFRSA